MASRGRIILIDDEIDLISAFAEYLVDRGFDAVAADGAYAFDGLVAQRKPDLVVLDLAMPGESGQELLLRIRAGSDIPVIIMTGRAELVDRVLCLEMGADDIVQKPIEPRELVARIQGLLDRRQGRPRDIVRLERTTVDLRAALVMHDNGTEERLTISEIMLFRAFLANPYKLLTRDEILDLAPAQDRDALDRSVDPRVARLKRKLATESIETRRGHGYVYVPKAEKS
ncbi:MAG: response regulator transcription factor [Beijerinckiaceae bacterium]|nr:response regulator transcription factor [Beijerinckiaceae bacterium]MCZ8301511.1 response regulator transcription factor [Beijerinckiaceae bacterium]